MSDTYWAVKRRQRAAAAEPIPAPEPDEDEPLTAENSTKAELIAAAEAAGIDFKTTDSKAEIAAKLAEG